MPFWQRTLNVWCTLAHSTKVGHIKKSQTVSFHLLVLCLSSPSPPLQLIATYIQRQELSSAIHVTSTPEVQQQQQETVTDGPGPSHLTQDEESGGEGEGEEVQVGTEDLYRQQVCCK